MSSGRNDPCPCGSGRKYKKCCMNAASRTALRNASPAAISGRIAYEGRVGRERKEWCESYIAWKTDQIEKTIADQKRIAETEGKRISCSKGCWFCCFQHICASLQECDAIVYWLHLHQDVREAFMARYPAWRSRLREHEVLFQEVNQAASISMSSPYDVPACKAFMKKAEVYRQLDTVCPFLDDAVCSIYPVRPLVCAAQVAVSPPENCKLSSTEDPIILLSASVPASQPSYFRGPENSVMFSPAPLLVHEIISGGFFYLNDLPGLDGIKDEAFSDPQIRALLT